MIIIIHAIVIIIITTIYLLLVLGISIRISSSSISIRCYLLAFALVRPEQRRHLGLRSPGGPGRERPLQSGNDKQATNNQQTKTHTRHKTNKPINQTTNATN